MRRSLSDGLTCPLSSSRARPARSPFAPTGVSFARDDYILFHAQMNSCTHPSELLCDYSTTNERCLLRVCIFASNPVQSAPGSDGDNLFRRRAPAQITTYYLLPPTRRSLYCASQVQVHHLSRASNGRAPTTIERCTSGKWLLLVAGEPLRAISSANVVRVLERERCYMSAL